MTTWKRRSPDRFNPAFSVAVDRALAQLTGGTAEATCIVLHDIADQKAAKALADKFRWWRWCLQQYPLHRFHRIEQDYTMKALVRLQADGSGRWTLGLLLRKRENLAEELKHLLEQ